MKGKIQVRTYQLLGGAYMNQNFTSTLTHSCEIRNGIAVRVLCKRVQFESICNDAVHGAVPGEPSCTACQSALKKLRKEGKI